MPLNASVNNSTGAWKRAYLRNFEKLRFLLEKLLCGMNDDCPMLKIVAT